MEGDGVVQSARRGGAVCSALGVMKCKGDAKERGRGKIRRGTSRLNGRGAQENAGDKV